MANNNINRALTGIDPLAYMGINASGATSASQTVTYNRAPTQNDSKNFIIGCFWLKPSTVALPADNAKIWMLTALIGNDATWTELVASGANGILTITGDSGGAVGPLLGNVNLVAGAGSGLSVVGNPGTYTLTIAGTGGGSVINQIDGDTGYVTGPTVSIKGNATAGATVEFIGDNATAMTFNVTDADRNTLIGDQAGTLGASGVENTALGNFALGTLTTGDDNTCIGSSAGAGITTGSGNTLIGRETFFTNNGNRNVAVGRNCANSGQGDNNTIVGTGAGLSLTTGNDNILVGYLAGSNYTAAAESNNIIIGNLGVNGESSKIRIGTPGTQNACYIAGIDGVNVGNSTVRVVSEASNQLGTVDILAGSGITVTPSANAITIATASAVAESFVTDLGTATPSAGVLNDVGGNVITTTGSGNTVTTKLTNGTDGQVIIGGGANPVWGNLTAGSNITITNAANSITIAATGGSFASAAFMAYLNSDQAIGAVATWGDYELGTQQALVTSFDTAGAFYVGDGVNAPATFTVPSTGQYQFNFNVRISAPTSYKPWMYIKVAGVCVYSQPGFTVETINQSVTSTFSTCISLTAGDVVSFSLFPPAFSTLNGVAAANVPAAGAPTTITTSVSGFRVA